MSDILINQYLSRGTAAERAAFTPNPPTPTAGNDHGYLWYETDTGKLYAWDGSAWDLASTLTPGFVTIAAEADLPNERRLTAGTGITVVDGGAGSTVTIACTVTGYTDEMAQDAVGGILADTSHLDFTYDDATPAISATIKTTATPQLARLGIGAAADATVALKVVGQLWIPLVDDGNSGAAKTIDWDLGNEHLLTLTDDVALTLSNPEDGGRYVLVLLQDGTGGRVPSFPASVKWAGGTPPTITPTASRYDLITLLWLAGAGIYLASINQNYSA